MGNGDDRAAGGTFTQIHDSNNNHLNTLILYGFGDLRNLPSCISSTFGT